MSSQEDEKPPSMSMPDDAGLGQLAEYKLLEKLGEGGMGVVYKALHTALGRLVALKVLSTGRADDKQAVARFQREMKAIGRLDDPNIVQAFDAREIDGKCVLVMEYVDGLDLGELVERLGQLPVADACELMRRAALGLEYADRHGLVHRDIKPSNLMLNAEGQLKILDLGLALVCTIRPEGDEMTAPGQVMGTPDYMAPEQVADSHVVDIRADVYSLGCTLYKLLSGRTPFSGPAYLNVYQKMHAQVHEPIPSIRQSRADVPEELASVLDRMLAKDPRQRFATPGQLVAALDPFVAGSDLARLVAEAQRRPKPVGRAVGPSVGAEPKPSSAASGTVRAQRERTPKSPAPTTVRWRGPWSIAVVLGLLVACIWGALVVIHGPRQDGGSVVTQETDANVQPAPVPVPPPPVPAPPLPGKSSGRAWFIVSWRPRAESGNADLWLIGFLGKDRRRVTRDPTTFDVQPQFSPDRRRIVFLRAQSADGPSAVCVCNTDGSDFRQLTPTDDLSGRFVSPVWVSNDQIYYAREPLKGPAPNTEIWQIDRGGQNHQPVFHFKTALEQVGGVVTDVSCAGRSSPADQRLAVIAQQGGSSQTADVYTTGLKGESLRTVSADLPDTCADGLALWSPDGKHIAWQHNFAGKKNGTRRFGVGLARLQPDGRWQRRLQPGDDARVALLAWSSDGRALLCARLPHGREERCQAELFLMNAQFEPTGKLSQFDSISELFSLEAAWRQPPQWRFCRLADWASFPEDVALPPRQGSARR